MGLLKDGDDTGGEGKVTDDELAILRKHTDRAKTLGERIKDLVVENAVLKEAGKYNPVNPVQVVRPSFRLYGRYRLRRRNGRS